MNAVNNIPTEPYVEAVLAFEELPLGASGSRRALVRWSDGAEGEACRWLDDEMLICRATSWAGIHQPSVACSFREIAAISRATCLPMRPLITEEARSA